MPALKSNAVQAFMTTSDSLHWDEASKSFEPQIDTALTVKLKHGDEHLGDKREEVQVNLRQILDCTAYYHIHRMEGMADDAWLSAEQIKKYLSSDADKIPTHEKAVVAERVLTSMRELASKPQRQFFNDVRDNKFEYTEVRRTRGGKIETIPSAEYEMFMTNLINGLDNLHLGMTPSGSSFKIADTPEAKQKFEGIAIENLREMLSSTYEMRDFSHDRINTKAAQEFDARHGLPQSFDPANPLPSPKSTPAPVNTFNAIDQNILKTRMAAATTTLRAEDAYSFRDVARIVGRILSGNEGILKIEISARTSRAQEWINEGVEVIGQKLQNLQQVPMATVIESFVNAFNFLEQSNYWNPAHDPISRFSASSERTLANAKKSVNAALGISMGYLAEINPEFQVAAVQAGLDKRVTELAALFSNPPTTPQRPSHTSVQAPVSTPKPTPAPEPVSASIPLSFAQRVVDGQGWSVEKARDQLPRLKQDLQAALGTSALPLTNAMDTMVQAYSDIEKEESKKGKIDLHRDVFKPMSSQFSAGLIRLKDRLDENLVKDLAEFSKALNDKALGMVR